MLSQRTSPAVGVLSHHPRMATDVSTVEPTDNELIAASQRGDAAAYGLLVRKYQNRLCSSLCHLCGSRTDAQDAAQEAFVRAYLKLGTYTGASAFYTWLYRIAVNAAISEMRKRKSRSTYEEYQVSREAALRGQMKYPDEPLLRAERVELVQTALNSLAADHRTVLVLREIENCDYDEISSILGIPIGTVRSRLHRARIELREKLCELTHHDLS